MTTPVLRLTRALALQEDKHAVTCRSCRTCLGTTDSARHGDLNLAWHAIIVNDEEAAAHDRAGTVLHNNVRDALVETCDHAGVRFATLTASCGSVQLSVSETNVGLVWLLAPANEATPSQVWLINPAVWMANGRAHVDGNGPHRMEQVCKLCFGGPIPESVDAPVLELPLSFIVDVKAVLQAHRTQLPPEGQSLGLWQASWL